MIELIKRKHKIRITCNHYKFDSVPRLSVLTWLMIIPWMELVVPGLLGYGSMGWRIKPGMVCLFESALCLAQWKHRWRREGIPSSRFKPGGGSLMAWDAVCGNLNRHHDWNDSHRRLMETSPGFDLPGKTIRVLHVLTVSVFSFLRVFRCHLTVQNIVKKYIRLFGENVPCVCVCLCTLERHWPTKQFMI